MAERLTIEFKAKGADALKATIDQLYIAQERLVKGHKAAELANKRLTVANEKLASAGLLTARNNRNVGGTFSVLRSKMLLASFATTLLTASFKKYVDIAAEIEETTNKATIVFGRNAEAVNTWSVVFGDSIGRASDQLLGFAASLQDTFVPLGMTRSSAAQLSVAMTKLAVDVASFQNKADADVVRDFQSALVGNHETVKKYGVIINESRLKVEAFSLGLFDGTGELEEHAKIQARVSLLVKGTSDAHDDAANTANSYTNQMKALNADLRKAYEEIGNEIKNNIMPLVIKLGKHFANVRVLKSYAIAIGVVTAAFVIYKFAVMEAEKRTKMFAKAAKALIVLAVIVSLAEIINRMRKSGEETQKVIEINEDFKKGLEDVRVEFHENNNVVQEAIKKHEEYNDSINKSVSSLQFKLKMLYTNNESDKMALKITKDRAGGINDLTDAEKTLIDQIISRTKEQKLLIEQEQDLIDNLEDSSNKVERAQERVMKSITGSESKTVAKKREDWFDELNSMSKRYSTEELLNLELIKVNTKSEYDKIVGIIEGGVSDIIAVQDEKRRYEDNLVPVQKENLQSQKDMYKASINELNKFVMGTEHGIRHVSASLLGVDIRFFKMDELFDIQGIGDVEQLEAALNQRKRIIQDAISRTETAILKAPHSRTLATKTQVFIKSELQAMLGNLKSFQSAYGDFANDIKGQELINLKSAFMELAKAEGELQGLKTTIEDLQNADMSALNEKEKAALKAYNQAKDNYENEIQNLEKLNELSLEDIENIEKKIKKIEDLDKAIAIAAKKEKDSYDSIAASLKSSMTSINADLTSMMDNYFGTIEELTELGLNKAEAQAAAQAELTESLVSSLSQAAITIADNNIAEAQREAQGKLQALRQTRAYEKASDKEKRNMEKREIEENKKTIKKNFQIKQALAASGVVMDTAKGITTAAAEQKWWLVALMATLGAAQLAIINSQKPPKMAQGGLIGGRRHSQGGTLIEAEQGEFVMNRDAVNTLGIETMNRINRGRGGGLVNISFNGNVMSDDFIEEEAIPKIKEAIRRGADIGIG